MSERVQCPDCEGAGCHEGYACPGFRKVTMMCSACEGQGYMDAEDHADLLRRREEGRQLKLARLARRETMGAAADAMGIGVAEYSRMERGQ